MLMSQKEWPKQVKRFSASIRQKGLLPNLLSQRSFTINAIGEVLFEAAWVSHHKAYRFLGPQRRVTEQPFVQATQGRLIDYRCKSSKESSMATNFYGLDL